MYLKRGVPRTTEQRDARNAGACSFFSRAVAGKVRFFLAGRLIGNFFCSTDGSEGFFLLDRLIEGFF